MDALESICDEILELARQNVGAYRMINGKKRRRVATGKLKDSLTYSITQGRSVTRVKFGASGEANKYANVIEKGRRKGAKPPPTDAIMEWMKKKPIRLRGPKGGFIKSSEAEMRKVAYLIARSIGVNGIEGIHYFEDAVNDVMEIRGQELTMELVERLRTKIMGAKWQ